MIARSPVLREVLFPYLIANEMIGRVGAQPNRYVIDFHPRDVMEAGKYEAVFEIVKRKVLSKRISAAAEESERSREALSNDPVAKTNRHHGNFLKRWWLLSYPREEMIIRVSALPRFVVCGQVTKRPIFEFVHPSIRPNAALIVFALADDYSFGILQSSLHWEWFKARCSTLEERPRYTSDTVFDSFCWPQSPSKSAISKVASAAVELRRLRRSIMTANGWSFRQLYRTLDLPGENPLRNAHITLDAAVAEAYGITHEEPLSFLLALNNDCASRETRGESIVRPGVPPAASELGTLITEDCIRLA